MFQSVAQAHRKRLNQRLALPKIVKDTLQKPKDEDSIEKLEQLRRTVMLLVEGEECVHIGSQEEADAIANAIERCQRDDFPDEVGAGCELLPVGARVQVDDAKTKSEVIARVKGMGNEWVRVLTRPFGTPRAPITDEFCGTLASKSVQDIVDSGLSKEKMLDGMLLCLFDALFLKQSDEWTKRGVSNMPQDVGSAETTRNVITCCCFPL